MSLVMPVNKLSDVEILTQTKKTAAAETAASGTFDNMFQSALKLLEETNQYTHEAEEAQMSYALGLNDNVHDLLIAQNKANLSLQYTVAIRNGVLDAYKEIMQMQF